MYCIKQNDLIPIELRKFMVAELSATVKSRNPDHKVLASATLLIVAMLKCNVSTFELRQLELDIGNFGIMELFMQTSALIGFDYIGTRVESLPHQNFPNERFAYLDCLRNTYTNDYIELIKTVRPNGLDTHSSLASLVYDLITDNLVPIP